MIKQVRPNLTRDAKFGRRAIDFQTRSPEHRHAGRVLMYMAAAAVAFAVGYVTPAPAQGAMAPEVRVIIVKPSREIRALDRHIQIQRAQRRQIEDARRAEVKRRQAEMRRELKEAERELRAYQKRVDDWKKELRKGN